MTFSLTIDLDNAAFGENAGAALATILDAVGAQAIDYGDSLAAVRGRGRLVFDVHGTPVGKWLVTGQRTAKAGSRPPDRRGDSPSAAHTEVHGDNHGHD